MKRAEATQVYRSVYLYWRSQGSLWTMGIVFMVAAALAALPAFSSRGKEDTWRLSLAIFVGISCFNLLIWWLHFITNSVRQCGAFNAQLTPGLRAAASRCFIIAWLAGSLAPAIVFSLALGHFTLFWLTAGSITLSLAAALGSGQKIAAAPLLLGFCARPLLRIAKETGLADGHLLPSSLAAVALLAAAVTTVFLIYGIRGDHALDLQSTREKLRKQAKSGYIGWMPSGILRLLSTRTIYDSRLNSVLGKASAHQAKKRREIFLLGFGYGMHWSAVIGAILPYIVMLAVFDIAGSLFPAFEGVRHSVNVGMMPMYALIVITSTVFVLLTSLTQTQKEQSVLNLLPGAPHGEALNRMLAGVLLRRFLLMATCTLLFAMAYFPWLSRAYPKDMEDIRHFFVFATVASLPVGILLLQPYASSEILKYGTKGASHLRIYLTSGGLAMAFILASNNAHIPSGILEVLAAAIVAATAVLMGLRWKTAINAPSALPVGRLTRSDKGAGSRLFAGETW